MIATDQRRNDPNLAGSVRTSISSFLTENGGEVITPPAQIPDGKILVSFDSEGLDKPVAGLFNLSAAPITVAQTLVILEPGLIDVRIRTPNTDSSPLAFLEKSKARGSAREMSSAELLQLEHPNRPIDELRAYIQQVTKTCRENGLPVGRNFHGKVENVVASLIHYTISRYYPQIDRGNASDIQEVCDLFAPDGVYDRAGKLLQGRSAIETFYTSERTLSGTHRVDSIAISGLTVLVTGTFSGVSIKENAPRLLEFADRWLFNTEGFVAHRHTYLSEGHAKAE